MPDPQTATSLTIKELWAAFLLSCSIVSALIAILYNRLNKDIGGHEESLKQGESRFQLLGEKVASITTKIDELLRAIQEVSNSLKAGRTEFEEIGKKLVLIQSKIRELEKDGVLQDAEAATLSSEIKNIHDALLQMKTEHKRNHPDSSI